MQMRHLKIQAGVFLLAKAVLFLLPQDGRRKTVHKNIFFTNRFSYENSNTASIKRRNVAGSHASSVGHHLSQ